MNITSSFKTLVINGSARKNGNSSQIVEHILPMLKNVVTLNAYTADITPCVDCRLCHTSQGCVIKDDFNTVTDNEITHVVIVSPIYLSTLTPPMLALASRFQADYCAMRFLKQSTERPKKRGFAVIVGGGDGKPTHAVFTIGFILKQLNAEYDKPLIYGNTDTLCALSDTRFVAALDEAVYGLYN